MFSCMHLSRNCISACPCSHARAHWQVLANTGLFWPLFVLHKEMSRRIIGEKFWIKLVHALPSLSLTFDDALTFFAPSVHVPSWPPQHHAIPDGVMPMCTTRDRHAVKRRKALGSQLFTLDRLVLTDLRNYQQNRNALMFRNLPSAQT